MNGIVIAFECSDLLLQQSDSICALGFPLCFFNFAVMFAVNLCLPGRHQVKAGHAEREGKTVSSLGSKADMGSALTAKGSLTVREQGEHSGFGDTNQVQPIV